MVIFWRFDLVERRLFKNDLHSASTKYYSMNEGVWYYKVYKKLSERVLMENLIALVDIDDNITGYGTKEEVHRRGLLHRAFSVFVVRDGKMLIQMRNPDKYHSGGLWSNACCSHQRKGEQLTESVHRRMTEELGFDCSLEEIFDFVYRTQFKEDLVEYEYDHVFAGRYDGEVRVNPKEASQIRWIAFEDLKRELEKTPERFSSWFIIAAPKVMAFLEKTGGHLCEQNVEGER